MKIVPDHVRSGCSEVSKLGGEEVWDQRWGALLLSAPVSHFSPHSYSMFTLEKIQFLGWPLHLSFRLGIMSSSVAVLLHSEL